VRVRSTVLTNVRSHRSLAVNFGSQLTIIAGPNGAGKTSILEAISLVLRGTLLRPGAVRDLITRDKDFLRIEVALQEGTRETMASAAYARDGERRLQADGVDLADPSRWRELLPLRSFVPDDLRLIKGGPRRRREFLDSLAAGCAHAYGETLRHYEEALAQRNALLRSRATPPDQYLPWEAILALTGLEIVHGRSAALAGFAEIFCRTYEELTGRQMDSMRLVYRTNASDLDEQLYREKLAELRSADQHRTYTHLGPHRDDLRLVWSGLDMREFASQGEQRAAVLALVLAEWRHSHGSGARPLLLLDDVMSELDHARRRALVALLEEGGQAMITTTDLRYFSDEELGRATLVELSHAGDDSEVAGWDGNRYER